MDQEYKTIAAAILDKTAKDPSTAARVILNLCQTINFEYSHMSANEATKLFNQEWKEAELVKGTPSIVDKATIKQFYRFTLNNKKTRQNIFCSNYFENRDAVLKHIKEIYPEWTIVIVEKVGM